MNDLEQKIKERFLDRMNRKDRTDQAQAAQYAAWLNSSDPGVVANGIICLIHQANYLLDQQISALEQNFIKQGGYSEQLAAARIEERRKFDRTDQSDQNQRCPLCGKLMVLRTARKGQRAGSQFWGCTGFPDCKGTRPVA